MHIVRNPPSMLLLLVSMFMFLLEFGSDQILPLLMAHTTKSRLLLLLLASHLWWTVRLHRS